MEGPGKARSDIDLRNLSASVPCGSLAKEPNTQPSQKRRGQGARAQDESVGSVGSVLFSAFRLECMKEDPSDRAEIGETAFLASIEGVTNTSRTFCLLLIVLVGGFAFSGRCLPDKKMAQSTFLYAVTWIR